MTTKFATAFLCLISFYSAFSQKAPIKFGNVSIEELKMSKYESDTTASAVVLADYGQSQINYSDTKGWQLFFERIIRIKIFKKEGYKWADFSIPLYRDKTEKEKLTNLKAVTYNLENGKIVETKMKSDASFEEKSSENLELIKFTLPNIKEGSVIEVSYKVLSDFIFNYQDWAFQTTIPVKWSEYRAAFPEFFYYEKFMQGYVPLSINETKPNEQNFTIPYTSMPKVGGAIDKGTYTLNSKGTTDRWVAENVPAFVEEPYMTTYQDYISKINFELAYVKYPNQEINQIMGTWSDINKTFLESEYFGQAVKKSGYLKDQVSSIIAGLATDDEKINALYNFVKSNVEWNGLSRKYIDNSFKQVLDNKKGSAAEINLLLVSMLQKAGFSASPVLVSTRDNGFVREQTPISSQFNYVLCKVIKDNKSYLLDATDKLLPINILPQRCLNGRGFIVSEENSGWISLTSPKSKMVTTADVAFTPAGELNGKLSISSDGFDGYNFRRKYFEKGEDNLIKDFSNKQLWEVSKGEFENVKNIYEQAKEIYHFNTESTSGDASIIYFNPILHSRISENPFKLESREFPVDFAYPFDKNVLCKVTIPDNYQIDEIPQNKILTLPGNAGKYVYSVSVTGNTINITSLFSINKSLFVQSEYAALREFYNQVVAKQNEQIVLKKKN